MAASYDAPMDSSSVVTPPYVAGPLRLEPFRALMLSPVADRRPRLGPRLRAALPGRRRPPAAAGSARATSRATRSPRSTCTSTPPAASPSAAWSAPWTSRTGPPGAEDRAILPHEGIYPGQADDLADRMAEMRLNPAPILLVHRATADAARAARRDVLATPPDHEFTDRAEQRHRIWAIREPDRARRDRRRSWRRRRALIADGHHRYAAYLRLQQRDPGAATDRGLAMLVDQDDTPLFLGAIHRRAARDAHRRPRAPRPRPRAWTFDGAARGQAVAALGPDTWWSPTASAGRVVAPGRDTGPGRGRAAARRPAPRACHTARAGSATTTPSRTPWPRSGPDIGVAVLMPAPDSTWCSASPADDRLLPEKATSFQPKPSLGVLIRSLRDE